MSKFTETQIVSILKEADAGRPVNEIWRRYGISSATWMQGHSSFAMPLVRTLFFVSLL